MTMTSDFSFCLNRWKNKPEIIPPAVNLSPYSNSSILSSDLSVKIEDLSSFDLKMIRKSVINSSNNLRLINNFPNTIDYYHSKEGESTRHEWSQDNKSLVIQISEEWFIITFFVHILNNDGDLIHVDSVSLEIDSKNKIKYSPPSRDWSNDKLLHDVNLSYFVIDGVLPKTENFDLTAFLQSLTNRFYLPNDFLNILSLQFKCL